jgi:hypothetical protein
MLTLYLRLTLAISRQQELIADEWSVRIAGKQAHISGLRAEGLHGAAFSLYLRQEVEPLARAGIAPDNLFEGFRRYTQSSTWSARSQSLGEALAQHEADPYDSHPALEERIAFAQRLELPDRPMDMTPAHTLLRASEKLERDFSARLRPDGLRPVGWAEVAQHWSELWQSTAARLQAQSPEMTVRALPQLLRNAAQAEEVALGMVPDLQHVHGEERKEHVQGYVRHAASAYLACVLAQHGFNRRTGPGEPIELTRGNTVVNPAEWVQRIAEGEDSLPPLLHEHGIPGSAAVSAAN